jgi:hypothetical protein
MTETPETSADLGANVTPELQQAFDDCTPLKGGDRPVHPRILEAREEARSGWKWDKIAETIEQQKADTLARGDGTWDEDDCEEVDRTDDAIELATFVYLGSYVITPSGKVYTPFATSNLDPCPECDGKGVINPEKYTPRDRLYLAEAERLPEMVYPGERTPEWNVYIARKNALDRYGLAHSCRGWKVSCNLCDGDGRHEPEIDAAWHAEMEQQANERGLFFDCRESDNGYQIGATFTIPIPKETSMSTIEAIKITARHGEGVLVVTLTDAFFDVEKAVSVFSDLATEFDELHFCDVPVTVEHVAGSDDPERETTQQMKWLANHLDAGDTGTLDQVNSLLEDMQETVTSFDLDEKAFDAYCELYGSDYLHPGECVTFSTHTRKEMIERELERLDLGRKVYDKIRHLIDDDAVLEQAEQYGVVVEYGGTYYVFDN